MGRSLFDQPAELDDRVARVITNTRAAGRQHHKYIVDVLGGYLRTSPAAQAALAEQYVGLPLRFSAAVVRNWPKGDMR